MDKSGRGYTDLLDHLDALRKRGLQIEVDRPIDKDSEMHPLVRWQYVGGIEEHERKAFLFTNVVNAQGRKYKFPVVVGAFAGNREIYGVGMQAPLEDVLPPFALPKREYMEGARKIWEEIGLPKLRPQAPWFGAPFGDWLAEWDEGGRRAATGGYLENGRISEKARRSGLRPETSYRPDRETHKK